MTTTSYSVSGMTCSHCVSAVTEEVMQLDGVDTVHKDLNVGGNSIVIVNSSAALALDDVRDAVDEAGYSLIA